MIHLDIDKGTIFTDGRLVVDKKKKIEDEGKCDDEITMEVIKQVAESIDPMIKFTTDVPSYHEDKKIAVLDLKIRLNEEMENRIDFEIF